MKKPNLTEIATTIAVLRWLEIEDGYKRAACKMPDLSDEEVRGINTLVSRLQRMLLPEGVKE